MRLYRSVPAALLALALAAPTAGALSHLQADPSGSQEVPPNGSPATGTGHFVIDTDTNTLFYHISYSGLQGNEVGAHIHGFAPPGVNAGVVHGLPSTNPKIGSWAYSDEQEASILAGLTYVNIHTDVFGGGEIRGQIEVDPDTDLVAVIDALQEVPPNPPSGLGVGVFDLDTTANTLDYDIRYGNLAGTEQAAHIHGPAPAGANAGVLHGLPAGNPKIGTWAYSESDEATILGGLTYINIHTTADASGEIRGQILLPSPAVGVDDVAIDIGAHPIRLAPNPAPRGSSVALFFRLPAAAASARVTVHDVTGRTVKVIHEGSVREAGILSWDLRDGSGTPVPAGVYFARFETEHGTETGRIVVLR
jgi:hypothetical protein